MSCGMRIQQGKLLAVLAKHQDGDKQEKARDVAERFQEQLKDLVEKIGKEFGPVAEEVRKSLEKAVGEIHKSLEKEGLSSEDLARGGGKVSKGFARSV